MFTPRSAAEDELKDAIALREKDPKKAADVMKVGQQLVTLAEQGDLEGFRVHYLSYKKRIMYWFVVKAFETALLSGHFHIAEHMLGSGVDLQQHQWKELLISCILAAVDDRLARDVTVFLVNAQIDINHQRRKDYFTALHMACVREFPQTADALIGLGADVNAVAESDIMPLLILQDKLEDREIEGANHHSNTETVRTMFADLQSRGAKLTWRRDHLIQRGARHDAESSDGDDQGRCFDTQDGFVFDTSVVNTERCGYDTP